MLSDTYKDKYSFFVDPNRSDPNNPGDALWQTCALLFSFCVLGVEDKEYYIDYCCREYDSDPILWTQNFLINYYEFCCKHDHMITHPDRPDHFSRDQLAQLILLIMAVKKYQPHLKGLAVKILEHIIMLDKKNCGSLHGKDTKDDLNNHMRSVLYAVCEAYGVSYPHYGVHWTHAALSWYRATWDNDDYIPGKPQHSYTIWNNLGLVTALVISSQGYKPLGCYFDWFADHGWGPAYKMVSGKPVDQSEIEYYRDKKTEYIDIAEQRGANPAWGEKPCLDYPILMALKQVWK